MTQKYAAIDTMRRPVRLSVAIAATTAMIARAGAGHCITELTTSVAAPNATIVAKKPAFQRRTLCETRHQLKRPTRNGLSTPAAWKTARQLRLTMRTRRRYSDLKRPLVAS